MFVIAYRAYNACNMGLENTIPSFLFFDIEIKPYCCCNKAQNKD